MPGLILEGGTFRPIFSAGVMDALLDAGLMCDYVIGVSAGITDGFSYVSRQKERNLRIVQRFRNDPRYLSLRNYPKCGSMFGLDFVFDELPNKLEPFDWDAFYEYFSRHNGRLLVGATNARTGAIEYFDGRELDEKCTMLRATCAIPLYFPPIRVNGQEYFDGGLADSIPIRKALHDGSRKNIIVLTQPEGYRKHTGKSVRIADKLLRRRYPALCDTMQGRAKAYNDTVCFCEQLAKKRPNDTVLLRPAFAIDSFEKRVPQLEEAYRHGYDLAMSRMDDIRKLFQE